MRTYLASIFTVIAAFLMTSCNTSTSTTTTVGLIMPDSGSVFVYHSYTLDTLGAIKSGTESTDTLKVVATGISFMGKTNVSKMKFGRGSQLQYMNFEPGGDLAVYQDAQGQPSVRNGWLVVGFASKGMTSFVHQDTTYTTQLGHVIWLTNETYTGDITMTQAGHALQTEMFSKVDSSSDGYWGAFIDTTKEWWAPEIGHLVKSVGGAKHVDLVGYVMK